MEWAISFFGSSPVLIAALAAGSVLCLGGAALAAVGGKSSVSRRLGALANPGEQSAKGDPHSTPKQLLARLLTKMSGPVRPRQGWQESQIKRDLFHAGFHSPLAFSAYLSIRMLACLIFPLILFVSPLRASLEGTWLIPGLAGAAGVGFMIPGVLLDMLVKRRKRQIWRELPDVLDLLVITVEAGLGLDAAIQRVCKEVRMSCPLLAVELHLVSLELKAGIPRDMALRNLANRCGVDEVGSLANLLIQADRFGVSVGRSLRVHSDTVRTKRRQTLEEQAAKIPLKLLFPVLFMIFPAIMAVMAGPAVIKISESMLK